MTARKTAKKTAKRLANRAAKSKAVVVHSPEKKAVLMAALNREIESRTRTVTQFEIAGIADGSTELQLKNKKGESVDETVAGYQAVAGGDNYQANHVPVMLIANYAACAYGQTAEMVRTLNEMLAQAAMLAPRDPLEGLLISQMVTGYHQGMLLLARASKNQTLTSGTFQYNQALRLQRLFLLQLEALNKHRGQGQSQQKVTVEHVHVHAGGQAVVGVANAAKESTGEGNA